MFDGDDRASLEMLTGKREDGEHDVCSFGGPPSAAAQQDDAWFGGASQGEEGAEVGHPLLTDDMITAHLSSPTTAVRSSATSVTSSPGNGSAWSSSNGHHTARRSRTCCARRAANRSCSAVEWAPSTRRRPRPPDARRSPAGCRRDRLLRRGGLRRGPVLVPVPSDLFPSRRPVPGWRRAGRTVVRRDRQGGSVTTRAGSGSPVAAHAAGMSARRRTAFAVTGRPVSTKAATARARLSRGHARAASSTVRDGATAVLRPRPGCGPGWQAHQTPPVGLDVGWAAARRGAYRRARP